MGELSIRQRDLDQQHSGAMGRLTGSRGIESENAGLFPHQLQDKIGRGLETGAPADTLAGQIIRDKLGDGPLSLGQKLSRNELGGMASKLEKVDKGYSKMGPDEGLSMLSRLTGGKAGNPPVGKQLADMRKGTLGSSNRENIEGRVMRRTSLKGAVNSERQIVRVGVILPLSGGAGGLGQAIKNGMSFAFEKLESNTKDKLAFSFIDDRFQARVAEREANGLFVGQKTQILVSAGSPSSLLVAKVAEQQKVAHVAFSTDPEIVRGRQYSCNLWVRPEDEARAALEGLVERSLKKVAVIGSFHEWAIASRKAFDAENNGRVEVLLEQFFQPKETDYRKFLLALARKRDVQAVVVLLLPEQAAAFAKDCRLRGFKLPLLGFEVFGDSAVQRAAEGALAKQLYVDTAGPSPEFIEQYQQRFPNQSLFGAAYGYDFVRILGKALEDKVSSAELVNVFRLLSNYQGALGDFAATGDGRFSIAAEIKTLP